MRPLPIIVLFVWLWVVPRSNLLCVELTSAPLAQQGDLAAQMVEGIDRFLSRELQESITERQKHWHRDFSSRQAYDQSVQGNRERLRKLIGAVDPRLPVTALELMNNTDFPSRIAHTDLFTVDLVRWPVFEGVFGEGLWLQPKGEPVARVVVLPDADQTPEMLVGLTPGLPPERQFARRLAENGCEVLALVLIDRQDTFSGSTILNRFTNQPHREWIYRQAYELGRHVIGYEVQKVLGAVDFFSRPTSPRLPIGVIGYAEGGLIALYAAALDTRIQGALVSGYFDSRQGLWEEPIYRNLFGLLAEFGDAELATLIAPRALVIEYSSPPKIQGPPKSRPGRAGAAPGKIQIPDSQSVNAEFERARSLLGNGDPKIFDRLTFITGIEGVATGPGSDRGLEALLQGLGVKTSQVRQPGSAPQDRRQAFDPAQRQARQVRDLEEFTQKVFRDSERVRASYFWANLNAKTSEEWVAQSAPFRHAFWDTLGRCPAPSVSPNPRSRPLAVAGQQSTGYEVMIDVFPGVFAWGYLLVPKDLKPGERRPVVVCQHGLEGGPADVVTEDPHADSFHYYKGFASRLADQGFVVFAPQNPYRGEDKFRLLQRKANPLGQSLFSIIIAQHNRILDWLIEQPFVDPQRIGFYGLSYGGKTAMRVPAVIERYALSICSGDFNEWIRKNVSVDFPASYMFTMEWEMPEFNLGGTFNYAEMAALIAPRPFMVERGHSDGVGIDEWVAGEYAKVRRFYDQLGIGDRTTIEFFNGPHTINGQGTFEFLHKHLNWPVR